MSECPNCGIAVQDTTHHGWYVSQIDTGHYELIVQIMPITEQEE